MEQSNARLVYTTDQSNPQYQNNQTFFDSEETANTEKCRKKEIVEKSLMLPPKPSNNKNIPSRRDPMEAIKREQELAQLAAFIFNKKQTFQTIIQAFPNKTKNQINNILQTLKHASKDRIKTLNGLWQYEPLSEKELISEKEFIDQVLENKSARWQNKAEKKRKKAEEEKKKQGKEFIQQGLEDSEKNTKEIVEHYVSLEKERLEKIIGATENATEENPVTVTKTDNTTCIKIKTNNIEIEINIK